MTWKETVEVKPVDWRWTQDSQLYKYEYTFGRVHVEDVPRNIGPNEVSVVKADGAIRWKYDGKSPVMIYPDRVVAKEEDDKEEVQNQAYYALSILDSKGLVSKFRQK